jgi:hypothetical protein
MERRTVGVGQSCRREKGQLDKQGTLLVTKRNACESNSTTRVKVGTASAGAAGAAGAVGAAGPARSLRFWSTRS